MNQSIELPDIWLSLARLVMSGLLMLLYAYDLHLVYNFWRDERDGESLRALIKSICLMLGIVIIFTGALNAAVFSDNALIRDALRFLGYVLLGVLIAGGLGLVASWHRDERGRLT